VNESYLASTRQASEERFTKLKSDLEEAESLIAGKACVYATGSFGRFEAGPTSDLDLFIVVNSHVETKDDNQLMCEISMELMRSN
jgi:UTP:GlnB (protein PII) uridylyltransferase